MLRIDFEDRLRIRRLLARGFHDPAHLQTHVVLVDDQAGRRIRQPVRHPDFLDLIAETVPDSLDQLLVLAVSGFALLVRELAEIELAASDILKGLAVEFGQADEIVDRLLPFLHLRHVFFQAPVLFVAAGFGAVEKEQ